MSRARDTLLAQMDESTWTSQVLELAQALGWVRAHFRPARTTRGWRTAVQGDGKGFPDLVLVKAPRVIFAELKSATGKLSAEQCMWLEVLAGCPGVEVYRWPAPHLDVVAGVLGRPGVVTS